MNRQEFQDALERYLRDSGIVFALGDLAAFVRVNWQRIEQKPDLEYWAALFWEAPAGGDSA